MPQQYGLGRFYTPDVRDRNYQLADLLPPEPVTKGQMIWLQGPILDQGQTPECVGFGWRDYLNAAPIADPDAAPNADTIYHGAQTLDGDPTPHDGSTVRAGAEWLRKQGVITAYHWAMKLQDITLCLLNLGPVVVGTDWRDGMFTPDPSGRIHARGPVAGGHCYLLAGVNTGQKLYTIQNSWGDGWAKAGVATISITDFGKLFRNQGEAAFAVTVGKL